jgi:hypothetical protein
MFFSTGCKGPVGEAEGLRALLDPIEIGFYIVSGNSKIPRMLSGRWNCTRRSLMELFRCTRECH